jgi:pyruvyl transferase EpsO
MIDECLRGYVVPGLPLAILDFPDIRNCGDSAIWMGEIDYLWNAHGKRPSYVSRMHDFSASELERVMPEGPIFLHGGGNFGDVWPAHQDFRERVIARFPNRPIIQFPQSLHFASPQRVEKAARAVGGHKDFTLLVRDEESKDFAAKHFDCCVRLCPDMAFCMDPVRPAGPAQFSVLAMLRADKEQGPGYDLSAFPDLRVEDWITESAFSVKLAKVAAKAMAAVTLDAQQMRLGSFNAAARTRVQRGIRQLSRGRAIVTDRLHVHIFSLLLGRPHAVLDNNYGKVRRYMRAFSGKTGLSYQASSLGDAIAWASNQADQMVAPSVAAAQLRGS